MSSASGAVHRRQSVVSSPGATLAPTASRRVSPSRSEAHCAAPVPPPAELAELDDAAAVPEVVLSVSKGPESPEAPQPATAAAAAKRTTRIRRVYRAEGDAATGGAVLPTADFVVRTM